jgi:hypothetical protein
MLGALDTYVISIRQLTEQDLKVIPNCVDRINIWILVSDCPVPTEDT